MVIQFVYIIAAVKPEKHGAKLQQEAQVKLDIQKEL